MNFVEILKGLNTPKDWATFVLGLITGVALAASAGIGLKNSFGLDLVPKGTYYTPEQVNNSFVSNQAVAQFYLKKEDVAENYVPKSELVRNYLSLIEVQEKYVLKPDGEMQNGTCPPVSMAKYMLRSDLTNYVSKEEVQRSYLPKGACEQTVLARRRINENFTLRPGDHYTSQVAGIQLIAHESGNDTFSHYPAYVEIFHSYTNGSMTYNGTHFEKYEFNNRRFTLKILSASKGVFRLSLSED